MYVLLLLLVLAAPADEAHYHLHSHMHGRQHDSTTTYQQRLAAFAANKAEILSHNKQVAAATAGATAAAGGGSGSGQIQARKSEGVTASDAVGHTLELNHFADWSRDDFDRVMLPLKWKRDHGFEVQKVRGLLLRHYTCWHAVGKRHSRCHLFEPP